MPTPRRRIPPLSGLLLAGAVLLACASSSAPLPVVPELDLARYLGRWYEIASFPQWFQRGCTNTTATYSKNPDGTIRVVNQCRKGSGDGRLDTAEGVAWVAGDGSVPARLKVRFFWPFSGDYQVIALDPAYGYAMVGHPSRDFLWILSRRPTLAAADYEALVARAQALGFDTSRLVRTDQSANEVGTGG